MGNVEKTVFLSYRRTNTPWALAIYQNLTAHGFDVFFDYESIASGDFEQIILGNIRARAHFLVVLTPSALERCDNPDDWLRREIETALDEKRNIVPIFLEGFDFGSPSISKYLTGKLANLKKYNGQNVPVGFFDEAMDKIRNKYLNIALDAVLHPVSNTVQRAVQKQQLAASKAMDVKEKELTAQEWFEKGFIKKLFSLTPAKPDKRYCVFQVKCNRCGEIIEGRVHLDNDLSLSDEGDGYLVRKTLMGSNRCFQQIDVELKFDSARQIQEKAITGGTFVE